MTTLNINQIGRIKKIIKDCVEDLSTQKRLYQLIRAFHKDAVNYVASDKFKEVADNYVKRICLRYLKEISSKYKPIRPPIKSLLVCPKCQVKATKIKEEQRRAADEAQDLILHCENCNRESKVNYL